MKVMTPYGEVCTDSSETTIYATDAQLYEWAHRPGARWPCSYLADCDEVFAVFDTRGDLVDLDHPGADDIPGDEFNAWTSDVLAIFRTSTELEEL